MASSGRVQSALIPVPRLRRSEGPIAWFHAPVEAAGREPGDRFPSEGGIAFRLRIGQATLDRAVAALEGQDILEVRPWGDTCRCPDDTSGASLTELGHERHHQAEAIEAWEALECKLVELAARRRSDADLAAIGQALARMEAEILSGGIAAEADREFHMAITRAAKNRVLASLTEALVGDISEVRIASLSEPERPPQFLASHRRTAQAIRDGDPDAARQAMLRHLRVVARARFLGWRTDPDDE